MRLPSAIANALFISTLIAVAASSVTTKVMCIYAGSSSTLLEATKASLWCFIAVGLTLVFVFQAVLPTNPLLFLAVPMIAFAVSVVALKISLSIGTSFACAIGIANVAVSYVVLRIIAGPTLLARLAHG